MSLTPVLVSGGINISDIVSKGLNEEYKVSGKPKIVIIIPQLDSDWLEQDRKSEEPKEEEACERNQFKNTSWKEEHEVSKFVIDSHIEEAFEKGHANEYCVQPHHECYQRIFIVLVVLIAEYRKVVLCVYKFEQIINGTDQKLEAVWNAPKAFEISGWSYILEYNDLI